MISKLKKFFKKSGKKKFGRRFKPSYTPILPEFEKHFSSKSEGYEENKELSEKILNKIKPDTKTVFIIDDNCYITSMLEEEINKRLETIGLINDFSIITMCNKSVGADFLTLLALHDINPDYMIVDIEFGKIDTINGKKTKLDGVDIVIETKVKNPELKFMLFTGNVITEETSSNYDFVEKFENYFGETIIDNVMIKDTALNFDHGEDIFYVVCKELRPS